MIFRTFLLSLFISSTTLYAQEEKNSADFANPSFFKTQRAIHKEERRVHKKEKLEAWRQKPWHIYVGFDVMLSYREQSMHFVDRPYNVHNFYNPNPNEGVFAGRFYLGYTFKRLNHIEISIENMPHELIFTYDPTPSVPFTSAQYINRSTASLISISYKRDILPKSKIFKLYPGLFFGIDFQGNAPGGIGDADFTGVFNGDTSRVKWQTYYKIAFVPIIGTILDADVNFWHFTLGLKFRLYYDPFVIRGENVQIQHNSDPLQKFKVESPVFNFSWGIGLRYTF